MKIAVTGGSGFLGKHLIEALLREGHSVTAVGREEIKDSSIRSIACDLLQKPSEEIRITLKDTDAVIHLAAIMPSKLHGKEDIVVQNKVMTRNALSLADSSKIFILVSSVDVYPYSEYLVDENTPLHPISDYGKSKKESEEECLLWSKNNSHVTMTVLRFSHLYGPADTNAKGIDVMVRNALLGKKSVVYGDGNEKRTYLFVGDAVRAILLSLETRKRGVFNVAGNASYSIREVISHIEAMLGIKMDLEVASSFKNNSKNKESSIVSSRKFAEVTGFVSEVNLHQGLLRLLPQNIFFDLDGPILDVKERYYSVYKGFVTANGGMPLSLDEYWGQKRLNTPLERLLEMSNCPGLVAEHKRYLSQHREEFSSLMLDRLQPQIKEVLTHLSKKYNLYLITLRRNKENLFRQLDEYDLLPFFQEILSITPTSDSKWKHKFDLLCEHHLQTEAGIVIGDTPTETLAAKKAGLTSIAVSNGIRTKEILQKTEPHLIVDSVEHLMSLPLFKLSSLKKIN